MEANWIQFSIILLTFVGLFIWNRTESRTDARHMDQKLESNRNLSLTIYNETRTLIDSIHAEIKDFHSRLCILEERNRHK